MDKFYLMMAQEIATHSHCTRRKVGTVLVSEDGRHIVTATNDPLPYSTVCEENGCLREINQISSGTQLDVCRCIHCETSVVCQCAKEGIATLNATVYTSLYPCLNCAKILAAAGVKRIVYSTGYSDKRAEELFSSTQIQVDQI